MAATPTRRNASQALHRASGAGDGARPGRPVSNRSPSPGGYGVTSALPALARQYGSPQERGKSGRGRPLRGSTALDWLAYLLRRWIDRRFATIDTEAYWWRWQTTRTLGGLGRRYRDSRFDTLAVCARCTGAGLWADAPCLPCLGTGRIALRRAS